MSDDVIERAARVIEEVTGLVGEAAWTAVTDVHVADEIAEALAAAGLLATTPDGESAALRDRVERLRERLRHEREIADKLKAAADRWRIRAEQAEEERDEARTERTALWTLLKRQTRRLGRWRRWTMDASTEIERLRDLGQQTSGWERQATPNMPSHRPPATEETR